MLRYIGCLRDRGCEPVLVCQPELVGFVRENFPFEVFPNGTDVRDLRCFWSVPIMSLPFKLGMAPIAPDWMCANMQRSNSDDAAWRTPRVRTGALRLGVCWKGSPDHGNDKDRSSPINFREAFAMDGVEIVSLQHGEPTKFRDFAATAEVIESCDAVVTVDTSVFHLAGTLGVPTYVIPPTRPELRFPLTHETTTPWYPSVTVVRRKRSADWSDAIARTREYVARSV
jgi:hypothetical protein